MQHEMQTIEIEWLGPYSWPGFEKENQLSPVPATPGVFLQTFDYLDGYVIYAAGQTRRTVPERLKQWGRSYIKGECNVLDVAAAQRGIRKEVWHGWGYARAHPGELARRQASIVAAANEELAAFRIFVAALPDREPRFLERLQAAIQENLYSQDEPFRDLPDTGTRLLPRRGGEDAVRVRNRCSQAVRGLLPSLVI